MPGARLENITNLADEEVSTLRKSDAVIVIGGTNDVNKNETNVGTKHLRRFIKNRCNTNIMIVTAPHRYDLQETSCVNKEIEVFNRKLHKVVKTADNVIIIQADSNRNDFTHHGLHLNNSGKEKMAKLIGDNIKKLMSRKEETSFILKWEENQKDPAQKEAKEKLTNDITKDHNLKEV
jgi:lysophospholipase L1-like esterase